MDPTLTSFVVLHASNDDGCPVRIDAIDAYCRNGQSTEVFLRGGRVLQFMETPAEITRLIQEALGYA